MQKHAIKMLCMDFCEISPLVHLTVWFPFANVVAV